MKTRTLLNSGSALLVMAALTVLLAGSQASAQCLELISGLRQPLGTALTNQGNLLVSENGTIPPDSGRISLVDPSGNRRTLLDGLPSAISDVGEPSGPHGIFMRGRTLYVAIGTGDVGRPGPFPGTTIPNPDPISSPIFSSFWPFTSAPTARRKPADLPLHWPTSRRSRVARRSRSSNGGSDKLTIRMVADFPDYVPSPLPFFADNVQLSNPFGLVQAGDHLYVTDGGRNLVWQVDRSNGSFSTLAVFPPIPNPLFPTFGGPLLQAVPTGIAYSGGQLLVTLFRGFPFPPGTSTVQQVDPLNGGQTAFITGLQDGYCGAADKKPRRYSLPGPPTHFRRRDLAAFHWDQGFSCASPIRPAHRPCSRAV